MTIDILTEETIPLAEAARRLPRLRAGRPVAPSTLWRWASRGLRGARLETVNVGGTCCTSVEALQRFFDALNRGGGGEAPPQPKARSAAAVERQLDAIGI